MSDEFEPTGADVASAFEEDFDLLYPPSRTREQLVELGTSMGKAGDDFAAVAAAVEPTVPDIAARIHSFVGNPDDVAEYVRRLKGTNALILKMWSLINGRPRASVILDIVRSIEG